MRSRIFVQGGVARSGGDEGVDRRHPSEGSGREGAHPRREGSREERSSCQRLEPNRKIPRVSSKRGIREARERSRILTCFPGCIAFARKREGGRAKGRGRGRKAEGWRGKREVVVSKSSEERLIKRE